MKSRFDSQISDNLDSDHNNTKVNESQIMIQEQQKVLNTPILQPIDTTPPTVIVQGQVVWPPLILIYPF
ncbi:TPA: hypothetical protein ACTXXA_002704 [Legionella anisa]